MSDHHSHTTHFVLFNDRNIIRVCVHAGALMLWFATVLIAKDYIGTAAAEVLVPIVVLYMYSVVIIGQSGWVALSVVHAFWLVAVIRSTTILMGQRELLVGLLVVGVALIATAIYGRRELVRRYHH